MKRTVQNFILLLPIYQYIGPVETFFASGEIIPVDSTDYSNDFTSSQLSIYVHYKVLKNLLASLL